jgi:hypothetical protein
MGPTDSVPRLLHRLPAAGAGLLLILTAVACTPALREPPSLASMAETDAVPADQEAGAMMREAEALFSRRETEPAREASRLTLEAALNPGTRHAALVETVRVLLWMAHNEEDRQTRAQIASRAVDVAVWCGRTVPDDAECDYWLGAALGIQAQARHSTGMSALPEIEAAFLRAAAAAPDLESAAPDRGLALFYLRAPGWPTGPGDQDLGLEHALRAVARFPEYPANLLALAEAYGETGTRDSAVETWQQALVAATEFTAAGDPDGPAWETEAREGLERATR